MRHFLFLVFCLFVKVGYCQQTKDTSFAVASNSIYSLNIKGVSSLTFRTPVGGFNGQKVMLDSDTIVIINDSHSNYSALIEIDPNYQNATFYSGSYTGIINLTYLTVQQLTDRQKVTSAIVSDSCLPAIVPVSTWRQGLTAPTYTPSQTNTSHIIVHHAATSNADKDPYQTVRNIYVQHTQVNGWSDIGYNFLIGRDGTIFQGRDSKGLFDYDYVVGAHMCGRNNGTMGICLLGNYSSEKPTEAALQALQKLIAWKSSKDNIEITGSSLHQIGPASSNLPDAMLNHVAGHREGCKSGYTECPGDALFALLPTVKKYSEDIQLNGCDVDISDSLSEDPIEFVVFPNPANSYFKTNFDYDSVVVYDLSGKTLLMQNIQADRIVHLPILPNGLYICHFFIDDRNRYHRLFISQ